MRDVLSGVFAVRDFTSVDVAPGGKAVVWEEHAHPGGLAHPEPVTAAYLQIGAAAPIHLSGAHDGKTHDDEDPVWSPDGSSVAFLSDARNTKGQLELYLANARGERTRRLTSFDGAVQTLRWSPDGKRIAVLYVVHPRRKTGALAAGARAVGVIGSVDDEQRIAIVDVASGSIRLVTPANAYVYEYGWAPDSRRIAYTYAYGNGDNNWWVARLATVDTRTRATHDLLKPSFQINDPQWSPDGSTVAVIGGIMSDFGSVGGDVYLVDAHTGAAKNLNPALPVSVSSLRWNDRHSLDLVAHDRGSMHLYRMDASTGALTRLTNADESLFVWSVKDGGKTLALVRNSYDAAPEIWTGSPGSLHRLTSRNATVPKYYGRAQSLTWKSDAYSVQGWLIYPLGYDPQKKYPIVTIVHGGPSAQSVPLFANRNISGLASHGFFVLLPNPRGSYGQGEAYSSANVKDFGYGDWRDDLAGLDAAASAASIDLNRAGLFGWSYGGYMAMWAETQTTRFKSIVAGAGIFNWQSYYGQNDIDTWMLPFFGASVYDDPAVYAKSSPVTYVKNAKTPVLILQGERDEEVPAAQSREFWQAMRTLGVPTQLVIYADEGHGPRKPANQIDILTRTVDWFTRYMR